VNSLPTKERYAIDQNPYMSACTYDAGFYNSYLNCTEQLNNSTDLGENNVLPFIHIDALFLANFDSFDLPDPFDPLVNGAWLKEFDFQDDFDKFLDHTQITAVYLRLLRLCTLV
jgi:hypothetical protein